jgi:hypothetical protein
MSFYTDFDTDPEKRLQDVVNGRWLNGFIGSVPITSIGVFIKNSGGFLDDLYGSSNNAKITQQIYNKFIKDDIQRLAGLYANSKYPTGTNDPLINSSKKDIIIGFFEGAQDAIIIEAIKAQLKTKQASGTSQNYKSTNMILQENIVNELASIDGGAQPNFSIIEGYFDDFGFDDWLEDQDEFSLLADDELSGAAALASVTASDKDKLETVKRAVRAIKGLPPPGELTDEDQRNVNQCALISDLLHKGLSYKAYPQSWNRGTSNTPFNGRIYPVTLDNFNPDSLVNMCTIPTTIKSFFNLDKPKVNSVFWDLYWVYMDSEGIKEEKIFRTNKGKEEGSAFVDKLTQLKEAKFFPDSTLISSITDDVDSERKGYTIKNIDIVYEGTNPSTARNDVKVTVKIKLDSLLALKSPCCYVALKTKGVDINRDGKVDQAEQNNSISERVEIKIADLVGGNQSNTYETTAIADTPFTREFIPDSSRIRLKVFTNENTLSGTDLLLNLATIDHTLSTPSAQGTLEMTITYRGYFEQAMNMPYNDALADIPLINARLARNEKIKKAKDQKCSDKLIREIARVNQEQERLEVESFHKKGGLIGRIYSRGLVYSYKLDSSKLSQGQNGNILDPRLNYVATIDPHYNNPMLRMTSAQRTNFDLRTAYGGVLGESFGGKLEGLKDAKDEFFSNPNKYNTGDAFALKASVEEMVRQNAFNPYTSAGFGLTTKPGNLVRDFTKGSFFFLGDLMDVLLDCLYEDGTADHRTQAKGMNLRFIMGTVRVPDPTDLDNFMTINPLQIPIDMGFFAAWYHDTIIKKGITHYPVGAFMKDLIERLINDVIYDTCFSILLPDEQPPQLRTTFFTDCDSQDRWFKTKETLKFDYHRYAPGTWFDPLDPYSGTAVRGSPPNILMKKDASVDIASCKNYCVIYQQSPSYFRQLKSQKKFSLKNDPYCPTMYYGYNMKNLNYLQGINLARSDSNYLKEARFFSSQLGNLSLMSNIYDVSFEIAEKKINTMFYPGNIINLIITDFEGGSDTKFSGFDDIIGQLNESDPHKKGTLANTLGIGGYHIIKSVTYALNNLPSKNIKVSIATKFTGTDAVGDQERPSPKTPYADEQATCITQYNAALESLRVTETSTEIEAADFDRIYDTGVADDPKAGNITRSSQTTRSTAVAVPLPANNALVQAANAELAQKEQDEEQAVIAAGETPKSAIQKAYNYGEVSGYTTKTYKKGGQVSTALFKDKWLHVKSKTPDTNNKTVTIEWEVGTFSGSNFTADSGPAITIVYKQ